MSDSAARPEFVIAIPIYEDMDLMDVAAPSEMFHTMSDSWDKTAIIYHVAQNRELVKTRDGTWISPHKCFAELPAADLLWTPGGTPEALYRLMYTEAGKPYLDYLRQVAERAQWVTSVCEGALLLAQAGLLNGYKDRFPKVNVVDGNPRYVIDRNRVTGGGISSGLDEALAIIELLAGTAAAIDVQRFTQYFPRPPVMGTIPSPGSCPVGLPPG
jgi:transcriptional regulator GlxA family with amidase domain